MRWLMMAVVLIASPAWTQTTQSDQSASAGPAAGSNVSPTTQPVPAVAPSADQVLSQMLRAPENDQSSEIHPLPPPVETAVADSGSGSGALAPGAPTVNLLREGTDVIDRVGRLQKTGDGHDVEFVFESDGRALHDPPMIILPNLKLMGMEDAAKAVTRDLRFRVTGTVTEYRGRNYLLLEKAVVVQDPQF
jgi:hypothetical protein